MSFKRECDEACGQPLTITGRLSADFSFIFRFSWIEIDYLQESEVGEESVMVYLLRVW